MHFFDWLNRLRTPAPAAINECARGYAITPIEQHNTERRKEAMRWGRALMDSTAAPLPDWAQKLCYAANAPLPELKYNASNFCPDYVPTALAKRTTEFVTLHNLNGSTFMYESRHPHERWDSQDDADEGGCG